MFSEKKKLIILGIRGIPAAHGGFETFAEQLAPYLRDHGWEVTVYCQEEDGVFFEDEWLGIKRIHIPARGKGSWGTIEFDIRCVADLKHRPGLILTLGYNTGFLSAWLKISGRKNVINMDGLEWKRAKYGLGPRTYLWLNERLASQAGTHLIADHPEIANHLSRHTNKNKITMIPYGSAGIQSADSEVLKDFGLVPEGFFTLIARPEPENSILEIVRSFSRRTRQYKLVVLGTYSSDHSYQNEVRRIASSEVLFIGAIYDQSIINALRLYSFAYLHGHQVGGTNPSLVEALGASNAVIAHDNPFNRWVAKDAGCYFTSEDEIDHYLSSFINKNINITDLRLNSLARWRDNFTWNAVLSKYDAVLSGLYT